MSEKGSENIEEHLTADDLLFEHEVEERDDGSTWVEIGRFTALGDLLKKLKIIIGLK